MSRTHIKKGHRAGECSPASALVARLLACFVCDLTRLRPLILPPLTPRSGASTRYRAQTKSRNFSTECGLRQIRSADPLGWVYFKIFGKPIPWVRTAPRRDLEPIGNAPVGRWDLLFKQACQFILLKDGQWNLPIRRLCLYDRWPSHHLADDAGANALLAQSLQHSPRFLWRSGYQ